MRMRRPPAVYCMLLTIAPTIGLVSFARQISKVSQIQQKKPPPLPVRHPLRRKTPANAVPLYADASLTRNGKFLTQNDRSQSIRHIAVPSHERPWRCSTGRVPHFARFRDHRSLAFGCRQLHSTPRHPTPLSQLPRLLRLPLLPPLRQPLLPRLRARRAHLSRTPIDKTVRRPRVIRIGPKSQKKTRQQTTTNILARRRVCRLTKASD